LDDIDNKYDDYDSQYLSLQIISISVIIQFLLFFVNFLLIDFDSAHDDR